MPPLSAVGMGMLLPCGAIVETWFNLAKLMDGFWFALGSLFALLTASLMRAAGMGGGKVMVHFTALAHSWFKYKQGTDDTINVTMNTTRGGVLTIDTWVDEHQLRDIWHNAYHVMRLRKMAALCTEDAPLITFRRKEKRQWLPIAAGGAPKYNEYRRTYDRLVNKIAAGLTNQNSMDFSLGRPMLAHRFVVALTYEKLCDLRAQHFRVLVINEQELLDFPDAADLPRPELASRFETLKAVAAEYRRDWEQNPDRPERFGILYVWRPIGEPEHTTSTAESAGPSGKPLISP